MLYYIIKIYKILNFVRANESRICQDHSTNLLTKLLYQNSDKFNEFCNILLQSPVQIFTFNIHSNTGASQTNNIKFYN